MAVVNFFRLLRAYFAVNLAFELQYRANFLLAVVRSLINLGTNAANLALIFSNTSTLAGWTATEVVAVLGVWFLTSGLWNTLVRPSFAKLMDDVRLGTLDYMLVKPESSQVLASVRVIEVWGAADACVGLALIIGAIARLRLNLGLAEAVAFIVVLLGGAVLVYSFCLMLATSTFWIVRADNILVIFGVMLQAGRYPVTIYPGWMRWFLTIIVPIAFATTVPVQAITGRLDATGVLGTLALAAVLLTVASWFWRFALRHYTGASA